jgi:hypothetical protein
MTAFVAGQSSVATPYSISGVWKGITGFGSTAGGGRAMKEWVGTAAATHVSTTPLKIFLSEASLYPGGGIAYATISIQ